MRLNVSRISWLAALVVVASFVGDDGESATCFAGAGSLDGRVQREEMCLIRNVIHGRYETIDGRKFFFQHTQPNSA